MIVLAILTFLTVAFLYLRGKYLASGLADYEPQSQRESMIKASEVLKSRGYRILDERVGHELSSYLGSRKYTTYVTADYLVEKDGSRYPVKVRSVRDPERISGAWLRKQFFPLYSQYEAPIGYVDPDAGTVQWIDFAMDYPASFYRKRWQSRLLWLGAGIALGWLLALMSR